MKNLFKAIELINNSSITRTNKENIIGNIRKHIKESQQNTYFLEPDDLERYNGDYMTWSRERHRYPYYRYGKNHTLMQLNGGYYIKSIKQALETGNTYLLKDKELYYEIDDKYYLKDEHFLFNGKCYKKSDYIIIDNKVVDRATINELRWYNCKTRRYAVEPYLFSKPPRRIGEIVRSYEETTDAFISVYIYQGSGCEDAIANSFQFDGVPLTDLSGCWVYNKRFYGNFVFIPIQCVDKAKFEVPKELDDAMTKMEVKDIGFTKKHFYNSKVKFKLVVKRWNKKFRMINDVLSRADFLPLSKANLTFKMIQDIMEVK